MADGELVYVLRSCKADGTSHGGFRWPDSGEVSAPDWSPVAECGGGLHGLPGGVGDWSLTALSDPTSKWYVVAVPAESVVEIGGKVKFPRGEVVYCGGLPGAMALIAEKRLTHFAAKQPPTTGFCAPASTTGFYAPASTTGGYAPASTTGGYAPASTTGVYAPASTTGVYAPASTTGGYAPASTTGVRAPASTTGDDAPASTTGDDAPASTTGVRAPASTTGGDAPASTTGVRAPASATGKRGRACCLGLRGRARAGELGSLILTRWDDAARRYRHAVGYVGEDGIEAGVWYELDAAGRIVRSDGLNTGGG